MSDTAAPSALLRPISQEVSLEVVRAFANVRADASLQSRYDQLAEKRTEGLLSEEEQSELQALVHANSVLSVLKAEAQQRLAAEGK